MTQLNIDDSLYDEIQAYIKDKKIEYPTLKNFCERAIKSYISMERAEERGNPILKDLKKEGDANGVSKHDKKD